MVRGDRTNTTRFESNLFEIPEGGAAVALRASGTHSFTGNDFRGPPGGGVATALDCAAAAQRSGAAGACTEDATAPERIVVRGNYFRTGIQPVRLGLATTKFGGAFVFSGNRIDPDPTGQWMPSPIESAGAIPVARGEDLLLTNAIAPTALFADLGEHAALNSAGLGGANLVSDPGFRGIPEGAGLARQTQDSGRRLDLMAPRNVASLEWRHWHWAIHQPVNPLAGSVCTSIDWRGVANAPPGLPQEITVTRLATGPQGPGFAPAVRFDLSGFRGTVSPNVSRVVHVQQFLTYDDAGGDFARMGRTLRGAYRLAGRFGNVSCWIRTNIGPQLTQRQIPNPFKPAEQIEFAAFFNSGVNVAVATNRSSGGAPSADCYAISSNLHSGSGSWELVSGAGRISNQSLHYTVESSGRAGNSFVLRFAIRIGLDASILDELHEPYVEICTPFVGLGYFGQLPRDEILTEAGEKRYTPIMANIGAQQALSLESGTGGVLLPSGREVVSAHVRHLSGPVPARVTVVDQRGRLIASAAVANGSMVLEDSSTLDAGTRLQAVCEPRKARVVVGLTLAFPPTDSDSAVHGL